MRKSYIIILGLVLLAFIMSAAAYPFVPDQVASHWNAQGHVDGYMSKFWGLFFLPLLLVGMVALLWGLPKLDPMKANIEQFRTHYENFIIVLLVFMLLLHGQVILWNLGVRLSMNLTMPVLFGGLMFYTGVLLEKAKRNWFIGIRTAWTLSSDTVWDKTHQLGAKLFKLTGLISLAGILFQQQAFFFFIVPVLLVTIYLVIYSYVEYRRETKTNERVNHS
jgi:uncharacterized membrane protein